MHMDMQTGTHLVNYDFSFGGDTKAHLRHRQMNNESVKRCREKKKQQHDALVAGYQQMEEDLKKVQAENQTLRTTVKKLYGAITVPANDITNKNLVRCKNVLTRVFLTI